LKGLGPKLPLRIDVEDGPYKMYKSLLEMISQNLKILVMTSPGERVMDPDFGVGARNFLFANSITDLATAIQNKIHEQANMYMPAINITKILIEQDKDEDQKVFLKIIYEIPALSLHTDLILDIN
jgi:phage baseplate assembly protein W